MEAFADMQRSWWRSMKSLLSKDFAVRNLRMLARASSVAALLMFSLPASAYIGPGIGAGTVAVVLGIIASVGMAAFAILWYPMKRMLKKRKAEQAQAAVQADEGQSTQDGTSGSSTPGKDETASN